MREIFIGDLVTITLYDGDYFGIVNKIENQKQQANVRLSNGLEVVEQLDKITQLGLHPKEKSDSPASFFELMKTPEANIKSVIKESIMLINNQRVNKGLDILFDYIDEACSEGRFNEVDLALVETPIIDAPVTFLLGLLSITRRAAVNGKIKNYNAFYDLVRAYFIYQKMPEDKIRSLLHGLKNEN